MTYHDKMTREEFVAAAVERGKAEIIEDISTGRQPMGVSTFGDLHDHVDANCYCGFCDDENQATFDTIFKHTAKDEANGTLASEAAMDAMNEVQDKLNDWLLERFHRMESDTGHQFFVLMRKRRDGMVYNELNKCDPHIYLTREDAEEAQQLNPILEQHFHIVPMLARIDVEELKNE